jgi:hypothetical protein
MKNVWLLLLQSSWQCHTFYQKYSAIITSIFLIMPCIFNKMYGSYKPCHIIRRNWPKCNHFICNYMQLLIIFNYMQLLVICDYMWLHLDIFANISCVGHIFDYIATNFAIIMVFIQKEQFMSYWLQMWPI